MANVHKSKTIGVNDLRKKDSPHVWVVNTSDLGGNKRGGTVNIPVTSNNQVINVLVYNTWIPQDLSTTVPKKDLVDNPNFMRAVQRRFITIVDDEFAEREMEKEENQEEYDRIIAEVNQTGQYAVDLSKTLDDEAQPEDGINATVIDVVHREELSDSDRYSAIRRIESQLKTQDWKYIQENTGSEKLKQMANNHLKKPI